MKQTSGTVIIAHRRRGRDYWDGYTVRTETEAKEYMASLRSRGRIARSFPDMLAYRADCNRMLDLWEKKRKQRAC